MFITYNMPLGDLINKSLRGEAAVCESWLYTYIKRLTDGDKGKLRQALKEVDSVVTVWKSRYFIPTYEVKVKSVTQGGMSMSRQDLDDTYNEEVYLQKEGKTGLVADFLYEYGGAGKRPCTDAREKKFVFPLYVQIKLIYNKFVL